MEVNLGPTNKAALMLLTSASVWLVGCSAEVKQALPTNLESKGYSLDLETKSALRLITPNWSFVRDCNFVHNCETRFSGTAKVVRTDGTSVTWNLIETWTLDDCGASPKDMRWYWTTTNSDTASYGWGKKDGESHHGSAFLRFTGGEGVFTAQVRTASCP